MNGRTDADRTPGDRWWRAALRLASAASYAVDVRLSRLVHQWREGHAAYELRGQCNHCGACCVTPTVALPALLFRVRLVRRLIKAWHRHVNLFELIEEDRREHLLVFRCPHHDAERRRCRCYRSRPGMCRDYPQSLVLSANPDFFESCGFYAHYRNADAMREALAELDLPPEKRAQLEERLHLRD
jgi:Fe-S-cluster containining protein